MELGLNLDWDQGGITFAASTGVQWGRIGWETGWPLTDLAPIVTRARADGLKTCIVATPHSRTYTEAGFPSFCASLVPYANAIEVHNENNHPPFAKTPDPVLAAAEMLKAVNAIKAASPTVTTVMGGLSPEQDFRRPPEWLVALLKAQPSLAKLFDFVGMHPYEMPYDPRSFDNKWNPNGYLKLLSDTFVYFGVPPKRVWVTEFGAPGAPTAQAATLRANDGQADTAPYLYTEDAQAEWFCRYMEAFHMSGVVDKAFWWNTTDGAGTGTAWEPWCGIRRSTGVAKPVARALRAAAFSR